MGLRDSKRVRRIKLSLRHGVEKLYFKLLPFNSVLLLSIYPRLVFNKQEFKQFRIMREVFKDNYANIIATAPLFFAKNIKKHFKWIKSQDFESKYGTAIKFAPPPHSNHINSSHINQNSNSQTSINKYPPLLNPESFNYHKIPANLAYHYNMPLPRYYEFIYLSTYGAGYQAMQKFFRYCGICVAELWTALAEPQREYEHFYNTLIANKEEYCIIYLNGRGLYGRDKLFALIDSSVPLLIVARDPISIYKPIVNHLGERDYKYECTLRTDYRAFLDSIRYTLGHNPSLDILYNGDNYEIQGAAALSIQSRMKALKNVSEITYIAFEQILEKRAFDTFNMLAKKYGFQPPKSKEIFEAKVNGGMLLGLLPRILKIHENDIPFMFKGGHTNHIDSETKPLLPQHTIIITTPQIEGHDISNRLIDISKELDFNMPFSNIYLLIAKDSYLKLCNNTALFTATKEYLRGFLQELENRANIENNKRLSESDMLKKFKTDSILAMKYKAVFDRELAHIKEHRPDIVACWKYYQEFEHYINTALKNDIKEVGDKKPE